MLTRQIACLIRYLQFGNFLFHDILDMLKHERIEKGRKGEGKLFWRNFHNEAKRRKEYDEIEFEFKSLWKKAESELS
jgi:hypothetical protein